jgi:hypothetical protein
MNTEMNETADNEVKYLKNPDVVVKEEEDGYALLFNPDNDQVRVLNRTGFYIWKLCKGTLGVSGIASRVQEAFEPAPDHDVKKDIEGYLDAMTHAGLIGIVDN